jgi:hypothetical protein
MRNWILATLILGAICFYVAGKASKAVKKSVNRDFNIVVQHNDTITTLQDYLDKELGR